VTFITWWPTAPHLQPPITVPPSLPPVCPSLCPQNLVTFVGGLVVAFINGWKLSLVVLACVPLIMFSVAVQTKVMMQSASKVGVGGRMCIAVGQGWWGVRADPVLMDSASKLGQAWRRGEKGGWCADQGLHAAGLEGRALRFRA